jgi:GH25 family lysozyme M1 (1,4-beta-N-acetylmuramidase)
VSGISIDEISKEGTFPVGIDVSYCQPIGSIDWRLAAESVNWCMVRSSYGAGIDKTCQPHITAARGACLSVGLYHFVTEAPAEAQAKAFLASLRAAKTNAGDIAPCLDLEWLPGGRVPSNVSEYRATVEHIASVISAEYGGTWIYTCSGFWQQVGAPMSWLDLEWWTPWYPLRPTERLSPEAAQTHKWPTRPGIPTPAAWQFDALVTPWSKCEVDHNIAKRLPFIV